MTENTDVALQQEEALANLAQRATKTKQEQPRVGMLPFMKMGKDGIWVYGQTGTEVQEGSLWAIDPFSYRFGYTCWTDYPAESKKKNTNLGKVTVGLGADPVEQSTLPDHIDADSGTVWPWSQVIEMELTCVTGEDEGTKTVYQTSSVGGLRAGATYLDLLTDYIGQKTPVALVELKSDSYAHPQWGKTYVPYLKYAKWLALNDTDLGGAPAPAIGKPAEESAEAPTAAEAKPEEEPKGRRTAASKDDGEAETDAPAPTRRRRPAA